MLQQCSEERSAAAPVAGSAIRVPAAPRTTAAARENISIAFARSEYATPYTDHTIPGSTPGHRWRHLGRQHQPADILQNHLSHALVAYTGGVTTETSSGGHYHYSCNEPWVGNAHHPTPPGGNYVLHVKNGGKRHFDEPSGRYSEATWQPCKRVIVPLQEHERVCVPHRRGRGVFNVDDGWVHPDAEAAATRREEAAARQLRRGGKALVAGPPDHTLEELSMWVRSGGSGGADVGPSSSSSTPPGAAPALLHSGKRYLLPHHKTDTPISAAAAPLTGPPPPPVALAAFDSSVLLPAIGQGVPPPRCTAAEADAVAQYHREKRVRHVLQTMKATAAASGTRAADVHAVRELPNW